MASDRIKKFLGGVIMQVVQAIPYKSYKPVDKLKERTAILEEFRGKKLGIQDIGNAIMIIKEGVDGQVFI